MNIDQSPEPRRERSIKLGNGSQRPAGGSPIDDPYEEPGDHELSPEMQLAWFQLNREQTQKAYIRIMRIGGIIGAAITPLLLVLMHYIQANEITELLIGLPQIHEDPNTAMIYWAVIGVFAGFLGGVLLTAFGFWLMQRLSQQ
jgi:hypothetical protein